MTRQTMTDAQRSAIKAAIWQSILNQQTDAVMRNLRDRFPELTAEAEGEINRTMGHLKNG
ncbi:hypothetical protein [Lyngbya sp. CCY1209]|uniref:hypothetical protein n=1 Tax=Lyngbya sp. CCY1209 TaxID=2886103 RepID=UPI002D206A64|nr:hypothetical protein [Lyngbya sp. CCY1209]MEB3884023.1 hypothetical protein [Lyngbya sp. CCY1209]